MPGKWLSSFVIDDYLDLVQQCFDPDFSRFKLVKPVEVNMLVNRPAEVVAGGYLRCFPYASDPLVVVKRWILVANIYGNHYGTICIDVGSQTVWIMDSLYSAMNSHTLEKISKLFIKFTTNPSLWNDDDFDFEGWKWEGSAGIVSNISMEVQITGN
jgi:hypothetical protein